MFLKYITILIFLLIMTHTAAELYWAVDFNYDFCVMNNPI
jgi:hypothetical protein